MIDPAERRSALWTFALLAGASLVFVVYCVYRVSLVWPLTSPPRGQVTPAAARAAPRPGG
jgi:hypothetical protein